MPPVPAAPGTAYQQQPQMAGYQQQPYRAQTYPQQPVDSQQYGQYQQPGVPGVPMAPAAPVAQKKSKKPLIIVLAIIIVAALVTGGVFLFLHLSQPGVNGTYSLSAGGNTGTLSVDGKKMSLDLPGNDDGKMTVSATIDKVTSGNGSHSYTLKDLKFSGESGNYAMSEVTGSSGLSEEQGRPFSTRSARPSPSPMARPRASRTAPGRSPARSWDWAWASQPTSRMMAH